MIRHFALLTLLLTLLTSTLSAQYYNDGQDASRLKWRELKNRSVRLIYPREFESKARSMSQYFEILDSSDTFGFSMRAKQTPVVIHAENPYSNGVAVWAPKRIELQTEPQIRASATPWLKQLSAHEYRHIVQLSNLNRGLTCFGSYIIGQQAVGIVSGLIPQWFFEGDATLAETQSAHNGRGVQPDFSIGLRMLLDKGASFNSDKWFCGSYKDYVPDHYHIGYQVVNWSYTKYGPKIWDSVSDYTARHPYFVFTPNILLHKKYGTSPSKLLEGTLSDLKIFWQRRDSVQNSAQVISLQTESHTTVEFPIAVDDSTIIAVMEDFDRLKSLVKINLHTHKVEILKSVPRLSSRPDFDGEKIWWSEYRPSLFWEQKSTSVICSMPISGGVVNTLKNRHNSYFATATDSGLAWVEYSPKGGYSIITPEETFALGDTLSVHSMAWDNQTRRLYYIGLSDCGIGIYSLDNGSIETVLKPSFVTIDDLRAKNGMLYFTSTISGIDETHCLRLSDGVQSRISTSRYGSRAPYPTGDKIVMTTYTPNGYMPAIQASDVLAEHNIKWQLLPENQVNPKRYNWGVANLDTITINTQTKVESKRFRKAAHLFNLHSWAPLSYNPIEVGEEEIDDFYSGVTLISQSLLSNCIGYFSWGIKNDMNYLRSQVDWLGSAVKFSAKVRYGGGLQTIYADSKELYSAAYNQFNKKHLSLSLSTYLPINLSNGDRSRFLTPTVDYSFSNSVVVSSENGQITTDKNQHTVQLSLQYNNNRLMSYREFNPRWGYGLRADYFQAAGNGDFGKISSIYGRLYLPGIGRHHSLMLRTAAQYQSSAKFVFSNKILYPRGANVNTATKELYCYFADYQLPLCYPDWGIKGVVYVKRLRLNLFYNGASYRTFDSVRHSTESLGGDLYIDFSPLSRATTCTARVSLARPNDTNKTEISLSVDMNF